MTFLNEKNKKQRRALSRFCLFLKSNNLYTMATIEKAKEKVSIAQLVASEGIPTKGKLFAAVWRGEKTASCSIINNGARWIDRGNNNKGGDVIDLYGLIHNCSAKEAIAGLLGVDLNTIPSTEKYKQLSKESDENEILAIYKNVTGKLLEYAQKRGINELILNRYCKAVQYKNNKGKYFNIGFKNDFGGWDVRSEKHKGKIGKAGITTLNAGQKEVSVFEGFIDFLSAVQLFGKSLPNQTCIILNSTTFAAGLDLAEYEIINLFLDNDENGRKTNDELQSRYGTKTVDKSGKYTGFNDLNEFLVSRV